MVSATALSAILAEDDLRSRARFALGGLVAGLAVGTFVTRDLDVDTSLLPAAGAVTDRAGTVVPTFGLVTRW